MKLKSVQTMNYKCIEDCTPFQVRPVTCLVGKNEAGKTSVLESLHKLNPDVEGMGNFDVLLEYPRRRRKEYQRRADTDPDDALITKWELDENDVEALRVIFGPDAVRPGIVEIRKGYYEGREWTFEGAESISETTLTPPARKKLDTILPKFLYFEKCNIMDGRIAIETLINNRKRGHLSGADRIFVALLEMVDTEPEHLSSIENSEELIADLEAASAPITDQIAKYWSQNSALRVTFRLAEGMPQDPPPFDSGLVFETRILNTRHNLTLNFDERSTGFSWFFSFLVWFSQVKRTYGDNLFVLLDDPGIGLHARAQVDLLRYIAQELEPHYQVIYTTHSPFMVEAADLGRARTVEDVTIIGDDGREEFLGTKVGEKVFSKNRDTLMPLRAAMGYELTKSMSSSGRTLLVEGPVEALCLNWFSRRLNEEGRLGLGHDWSIVPCGGGERIGAFMGLFGANDGDLAVLLGTAGGPKIVEHIRNTEFMRGSRVLTVDKYIEADQGGIEDIIGRDTYFALVNMCYRQPRKRRLPLRGEPQEGLRVLEEVHDFFADSADYLPKFDRFTVAEFLVENTKKCKRKLPGLSASLERFEKLFADINAR
ncbi:MAG: ATP-dependent nuclease [Planctomycetota bacterium]|jgi:predicted ATP-dependent endonuclease of OLD family